ncbi:MAG: guanylate kinase [Candidatus Zixiibacteriota bacterium]
MSSSSARKFEKPGKIVIISSPSGGGKTSICKALLSGSRLKQGWRFSVSYTTRRKRNGEKNGREYFFVTEKEFDKKVRKAFFAEHFKVHLYEYGTPRRPLDEVTSKGGVIILDVDVQGAEAIRRKFRHAISIFVLPPSVRELRHRLRRRGTETKEQLQVRFENAKREMREYKKFPYTVINKDLPTAVEQVLAIIKAHPCRTEYIMKEQIKKIIG